MRTTRKTPGLRIVGGTAYAATEAGIPATVSAEPAFRHAEPPLTETATNGRLREKRNKIWRKAEAATRYRRVRIDLDHVVSIAQREQIPEAAYHPVVDHKDLRLVDRYREALVKQMLTPAPDLRSVTWKQQALARGDHYYTGVKAERIERAIAEDQVFLAAHPIRHNNSEAAARRRDFKETMRRRIRDIAASRDLSDDEIKPALTLKHREIARFAEQHGVRIEWLLEGKGRISIAAAASSWTSPTGL